MKQRDLLGLGQATASIPSQFDIKTNWRLGWHKTWFQPHATLNRYLWSWLLPLLHLSLCNGLWTTKRRPNNRRSDNVTTIFNWPDTIIESNYNCVSNNQLFVINHFVTLWHYEISANVLPQVRTSPFEETWLVNIFFDPSFSQFVFP